MSQNQVKRDFTSYNGFDESLSIDSTCPKLTMADHDFNIGDLVTPKYNSDIWFLNEGAIGKILGFETNGYVAVIEWRQSDISPAARGHQLHKLLSVDLIDTWIEN